MKKQAMLEVKTQPSGPTWSKLPLALLAVAAALTLAVPVPANPPAKHGDRDIGVMTVNLYVGGDIGSVIELDPYDPNYPSNLVAAVTGVYYQILASDPPARLQTLARKIAREKPTFVAVSEASLIRVQSPGDLLSGGSTPATEVVYDYLQMLVADLESFGATYEVVATGNEIDVEMPMFNMLTGTIDDVRLNDREAILVRVDRPCSRVQVSNPQSGNFANVIQIPAIGLAVERGWCSVDVDMHGREFRFVCTHLEEESSPDIQALQAQELLAGPAMAWQPVILVGDFNADPLHRDGSFAYDLIPAAGFTDAWAKLHHKTPAGGLTWGHDPLLADPKTRFDRRIDFVFYQGKGLQAVDAEVIDLPTGLRPSPRWASDHAAVSATFKIK